MRRIYASLLALSGLVSTTLAQHQPQIVWSTNGHSGVVGALAFSKDGTFLASGGRAGDGTGRVWRVSNRSLVQSFSILDEEGQGSVTSFAFSPDSSLLGMGDSMGRFRIWSLPSAALVYGSTEGTSDRSIDALCFSPNGSICGWAYQRPGIYIKMTPDGSMPGTLLHVPDFPYPEDGPFSRDIRFSADGKWLALGFSDHTARIYRMTEGYEQRNLTGHSGEITSVDFSPDGRMLATTAADGDARLWSIPGGELIRTIRGGGGRTVDRYKSQGRFSADGKSLLTLSDGAIRFWSVPDGRLLLTYPDLEAFSVAVAPDGKHFAYGTGSLISTTGTVVLARWPLLVTGAGVRTNAMHLDWQGGSGLYQVERRTNLSSGNWEAIAGPVTNTNLQVPLTTPAGFFRIQDLTNAP